MRVGGDGGGVNVNEHRSPESPWSKKDAVRRTAISTNIVPRWKVLGFRTDKCGSTYVTKMMMRSRAAARGRLHAS